MSIDVFLTPMIVDVSISDIMFILCAKIIACQRRRDTVIDGALVISKGIIKAIDHADHVLNQFPKQDVLQLQNVVIMPGLVNTHVHLELPSLLDSIRAQAFPDWVLNLIRAKKKLNEKDYAFAVSHNIHTLIRTGTTTCAEICTHATSPALLKNSGMRARIYDEIITMGTKPLLSHRKDSALVKSGLSPHSPYTVSEPVLRTLSSNRKKHLKLAMHIAESKDEILLLQRRNSGLEKLFRFANWDLTWAPKGSSSFEYLNRIGFLSPALLAVHAVQVTDDDIELIRRSGTSIAHCPRSNKELGVGRMPLKKFLNAGITVGLGTDSLASVPTLNMWDEMRYAYRIHRREGISAKDIFSLATIGGAKALGLDKEIGTLEPGKKADMIAVPLPKKNTGDIYSDLLRETKSCIMNMVNGKILYRV
jgi:cytosine/adenosine deaminase-related metal-dependent hydrolase